MSHKPPLNDAPSYRLAYKDDDFLGRPELRPVRLQLELLKPELLQQEEGISSTVVVFGSTRIREPKEAQATLDKALDNAEAHPQDELAAVEVERARRLLANSRYYNEAREFARLVSATCQIEGKCDYVVVTGGGPGIMEAANRGAADAGGKSIGLGIVLPGESEPNPYITPSLCFQFHYFAIRKMHFLMRARALVAFPGGFGTMDELFETLTLLQTRKIDPVPVLLFGRSYWEKIIDFREMVMEGTISPRDLALFSYVETAQEAWDVISAFTAGPDDSGT
ncbi:MAG: TIGR00730 family Rossman fold protein [Acidobacteria bacterium]|nr:MAG: TIGR00730 family Rossman fold protein [Acidobacteriota bacterium]